MKKKKSPTIVTPMVDTGIYRDEPAIHSPLMTVKDWSALEDRTTATGLFDIDRLLTEAETQAKQVRTRWRSPDGRTVRAPSKAAGIPHNVARRVHYAELLLSYVAITRQALDAGDVRKAAAYAYWVDRYYEGLRVTHVEHIAKVERGQMQARKKGGASKKTPPEVVAAWRAESRKLKNDPRLNHSTSAQARAIARTLGGNWETIRKYIRV